MDDGGSEDPTSYADAAKPSGDAAQPELRPEAGAPSPEGRRVANFRIEREIGRGGMATVYLAIQDGFEREVALKIMDTRVTSDEAFARRFLREARIVAKLSHPNIVSVYDVGVFEAQHYLAMEYQPGGELKARIAEGIDEVDCIWILRQVAEALDAAHSMGYVHRDIKPANILFARDRRAVLTDFGIAKAAVQTEHETQAGALTRTGFIIGTPTYMSPEQARGGDLDGRSDLYSLGVVFYEMLTGTPPFRADDSFAVAMKHLSDPIPALPAHLHRYEPVVQKLLAKDPADRYESARALARELASFDWAKTSSSAAPLPRIPKDDPAKPGFDLARWRIPLAAAGATAAIAAAAVFIWWGAGSEPAVSASPTPPAVATPGPAPAALAVSEPAAPGASVGWPPEISRLLVQAEAALAVDRLSQPEGDNALGHYRAVQAIDPGNEAARLGLARVADRYIELSSSALAPRRLETSRRHLESARELAPDHPDIARIERSLVDEEQASADSRTRIDTLRAELRVAGLLKGAEAALGEGRLDVARDKYREVLELDAGNADARAGLAKVAAAR